MFKIADLFCGAGGTSMGAAEAVAALGKSPHLTAVNHWPIAIETHTANHPAARHLCTGVDDVNPRSLYERGELDLLWASPECTHHSRARGGKPMDDQSRATGHCVTKWAEQLTPGIILVENVPEFLDWGPIGSNGKPLKPKKGATFRAWVAMLESLGYRVDHRILCAADYGDPTTRQRLFVQAVRGRRRIVWPHATHAPTKRLAALKEQGDLFVTKLLPWVPARDIIDWSLPGRWLDEMPGKKQYGGLPLSPKTLRRIIAGLLRYGLKTCRDDVDPFIVAWDHTGTPNTTAARSASEPLSSVTSKARHGLVDGFIVALRGTGDDQIEASARSLDEPLSAITAGGGHHGFVNPYLVHAAHGDSGGIRARSVDEPFNTVTGSNDLALILPQIRPEHSGRTRSVEQPMNTICGNRGETAILQPHLLPQSSGGVLRPVDEPVPTIATAGAIALVEPFLVKFYGTSSGASVNEPMDTITTKDRFALVQPLVEIAGQRYRVRLRWRMFQPHELALGQGFRADYRFTGNKTEQVRQIGNAVPRRLARAIVAAAVSQNPDVSFLNDTPTPMPKAA